MISMFRSRPTSLLAIFVACAVGLSLTSCSKDDSQDQVPPTQSQSPVASSPVEVSDPPEAESPSPSAPSAVVTETTFDDTVNTKHFAVSVLGHKRNEDGTAMGFLVYVCYRNEHPDADADGKVGVGPDTWLFGVYDGETDEDTRFARASELGEPTEEFGELLEDNDLLVDQCDSRWIAVRHDNPDLDWRSIRYQSAEGDEITWPLSS